MDWIKINDEGDMEFVSNEVKLVPEVQALLALTYNKGKGDYEGRNKKRAKTEFKYLFLAYSPKSPYKDYNEKDRIAEAKIDCLLPDEWEESKELKALIPKFQRGTQSKVSRLLATVEKFLDKFENHLNSIDLNERNQAQGLVHKVTDVMATLERLPRFAETLQELENQARSGVIIKNASKGDHEVGWINKDNIKLKKKEAEVEENE